MKKIIALAIAAAMVFSLFAINSFATVEHVIDGIISEGEYVTKLEMRPDNVKTWTRRRISFSIPTFT